MQLNVLRKWEFFSSSLHLIFGSENFRFPFFLRKNSLTWGVKCGESANVCQKIVGNLQISFENCTWMERSSRNLKRFSSNRKFSEQIFYRKRWPGAPAVAWENSRHFTIPQKFRREMTSEEQAAEKFHTDDVSLPRSG